MSLRTAAHLARRAVEAGVEALGHAWTRSRDARLMQGDTVWTTVRGVSLAATPVVGFVGDAAIAETLERCTEALKAAGVEHAVAGSLPERPTVVVPPLSWGAAVDALARLGGAPIYVAAQRPRPVRGSERGPLRLFQAWATPGGDYLAGPDVGIDLSTEPPDEPPAVPPIDLVFTWVDGADPAWRERRRAREQGLGREARHETADNDARFLQVDELRHALLAVERFAPWRRRVFLVTDGQQPEWLAAEFPQVTLVRHDEIFDDPAALPTFNSHAIESRLHHIPGLAEHWIYLNDDVFLGGYTPPSFFFDGEWRPRVFLADEAIASGPATLDDQPVVAAAKNNDALLARLTGARVTHKLKHVPHPQLRSVTLELEARAPAEFRATQASPFRAPTDLSVASSLAPFYALATGRAVQGSVRHFYADVGSPELRWRLPRLLEHRDAEVVCLNATTSAPASTIVALRAFLRRYVA